MKRVISLILCILMMVSIVPGFVFAEDANHAGFWSQWLEGITIHNLMNKAGLTACHPAEAMDLNALTRSFFRLTNACEHSYGEPEFDWESDEDLVYATFECKLCGAQEIIASEYEVKQVPATDTEPAKIVKYVTVEFNGESYYNEYVIIVPDEHDHDYDGPEWSFDTSENLVGIFTCKVCEDQQVVVCTNAKVKSTQAASCTTPKTIVYTGSIQFEGKTYTHEWNKEFGKALGHQFGAWTVSTRPSCTEAGIESRTCSRCQEVETREYGSALGHEFSDWTVNQEPTCTEKGEESRLCARCLTIETHELEALGHNYEAAVTEPGCTAGGYTTYTCSRCGDSYVADETDALGHDFGEWAESKKPTCTEKGQESRTCSRCGETETRETEALGHDYQAVVTEPSCTEGGYTTYTCSRCGDTYTADETAALGHKPGEPVRENESGSSCTEPGSYDEVVYCSVCHAELSRETNVVATLGHNFGEWNVEKAPSCTEKGREYRRCVRCGASETRDIDALGHDLGAWTVTKAPTCTEKGAQTRSCKRCDYTEDQEVDALGHDLGAWTVTKAPTCTEKGAQTRSCSRCDYTEDGEVAALGHNYGSIVTKPTCTEKGYTSHTCSRCGDSYNDSSKAALGHDWDAGKVTKQPTVSAEGVKTYTCKRCGTTKTEPIAKLPAANFVDVKDPKAYYYDAVYWAVAHKPYQITAGLDKTHFGPDKTVTRAQAMVFFWAAKDRPKFKKANTQFVDVKKADWYYKAIMWAVENNITAGTDATHFSPNKTCNRGEILAFLYAAMKKPKVKISNPYKDVTNQWYKKAALWAYANKIEKGENGKFNANTPCTRASVVTYLYRFLERKSLLN